MSRAMTMLAPGAAPRSKKKPLLAGLGVLAIGAAALFYLQPWQKSAPPSPSAAPEVAAPSVGSNKLAAVAKAATFGRWQNLLADPALVDPLVAQGLARRDGQALTLPPKSAVLTPGKYRDGAVRLRAVFTGKGGCALAVRERGWQERYSVRVDSAQTLSFYFVRDTKTTELRSIPLPQPLTVGREYLLELRVVGSRLSVSLDGAQLDTREHTVIAEPGSFGAANYTASDHTILAVEFLDLDPPAAAAPPFGPWQPFFTDAEWKETVPGKREVVDGRLHLMKGNGPRKPQPSADGAIRARIQFQQGTKYVGFDTRATPEGDLFKAHLSSEKGVVLELYQSSTKASTNLGRYSLPKPLQPGDTLLLELRLKGDHLTVLVNGAEVIKAQDSRLPGHGEWSITANDGWFESVEVQTPLPVVATGIAPPAATAATVADGWEDLFAQLTPEIVAQSGKGWSLKDGELFGSDKTNTMLPLPATVAGTSYQVRVKLRRRSGNWVFHVVLPVGGRMCGFELDGHPPDGGVYTGLTLVNGVFGKNLPGAVAGEQVKDPEPHDLEVTVRLDGANATITTTLDTRPLYAWTGPTAALSQDKFWATTEPGALALGFHRNGWAVSEVKVKRLDSGASAPPAAATTTLRPHP